MTVTVACGHRRSDCHDWGPERGATSCAGRNRPTAKMMPGVMLEDETGEVEEAEKASSASRGGLLRGRSRYTDHVASI